MHYAYCISCGSDLRFPFSFLLFVSTKKTQARTAHKWKIIKSMFSVLSWDRMWKERALFTQCETNTLSVPIYFQRRRCVWCSWPPHGLQYHLGTRHVYMYMINLHIQLELLTLLPAEDIYIYTLNKIINATLLFLPHFSWAELKDLRLFLCTQKAYFSQILFTNLSKSVLVSRDNPSTSQVWHIKMLIRQHDCTGVP